MTALLRICIEILWTVDHIKQQYSEKKLVPSNVQSGMFGGSLFFWGEEK
jgi:hypothetical protein